MKFRVASDKPRTVDYLGVFDRDSLEREFTEGDAAWYVRSTGLPLTTDNLPEGVEVTIVLGDEDDKE